MKESGMIEDNCGIDIDFQIQQQMKTIWRKDQKDGTVWWGGENKGRNVVLLVKVGKL